MVILLPSQLSQGERRLVHVLCIASFGDFFWQNYILFGKQTGPGPKHLSCINCNNNKKIV